MCFRPASPSQSIVCPNCGKSVNAVSGLTPAKCPFCKESLEGVSLGDAPAPQAPGAPAAPAAPGAPGAPKAPGVPKGE